MQFVKQNRIDILIFLITTSLCLINQKIKDSISGFLFYQFFKGYFNDLVGSVSFVAAINIALSSFYKPIRKMWHIFILMLISGLYWELVVPLYRTNSVTDFFDIIAYVVGGVIYWLLFELSQHIGNYKV